MDFCIWYVYIFHVEHGMSFSAICFLNLPRSLSAWSSPAKKDKLDSVPCSKIHMEKHDKWCCQLIHVESMIFTYLLSDHVQPFSVLDELKNIKHTLTIDECTSKCHLRTNPPISQPQLLHQLLRFVFPRRHWSCCMVHRVFHVLDVAPSQDSSDHRNNYIFRLGIPNQTFIYHWNPGRGPRPNHVHHLHPSKTLLCA